MLWEKHGIMGENEGLWKSYGIVGEAGKCGIKWELWETTENYWKAWNYGREDRIVGATWNCGNKEACRSHMY